MQVIIARVSGFCDGVKRAMRIALDAAALSGGLRCDGPLVHNRQALELLTLHGIDDSPAAADSGLPVLVRAHGVPPERRKEWLDAGLRLVDATCVHVARNQRLAAEAAGRGETVILAGDAGHAEVRAVAASAGPGCVVVEGPDDIGSLPGDGRYFLLAQTTFNVKRFREIADALAARFPSSVAVDTICRATHLRQEEAGRLAGAVDAVVVVGGRNSANTARLAETVRNAGTPVFTVETAAELVPEDFAAFDRVGVTSGASTPGWITQDVVNRLRFMGRVTPGARLLRGLHLLTESRVLTALSAAGLALAAQRYLLGELRPALAAAGAGYVFFAHTLNRRVPAHPEARRLSLTDSFYQDRRRGLLAVAWLAAALSLALSAREGRAEAVVYGLALLATIAYSVSARRPATAGTAPRALTHPRNWAMAAGWACTLAGPPAILNGNMAAGIGTLLFVFLVCTGGTLIRDLHDVASDSLVGIGTLPARLGGPKALKLARYVLLAAAVLPLAAAVPMMAADWSGWFGEHRLRLVFLLVMPIVPALGLNLLGGMERGKIQDAVMLQARVDCLGCLAGAIALILGGGN